MERFLIARGERVVRVPTAADGRRRGAQARERGKSDRIDALAVARAALREGLETLPAAQLDGPELDLRLLVDHRERLVRQRVALNNTLQWHLHDLWPELELPGSALFSAKWRTADRPAPRARRADDARPDRPRRAAPPARADRSRSRRSRPRSPTWSPQIAPQLLAEPGFGPLTAAKLVGEIAGADRFATDAKLARAAGVAPIPVSSGKTNRHRLDRGGNRQINAAHPPHRRHPRRAATPKPATTSPASAPKARRTREAIRCLKRHLARRIWHLLQPPAPDPGPDDHTINFLT